MTRIMEVVDYLTTDSTEAKTLGRLNELLREVGPDFIQKIELISMPALIRDFGNEYAIMIVLDPGKTLLKNPDPRIQDELQSELDQWADIRSEESDYSTKFTKFDSTNNVWFTVLTMVR